MDASKNSPCPCGSERRFRHCHGKQKPARRGAAAEASLMDRLTAYPAAQELAAMVVNFFGMSLEYYEDPALDSSKFEINFDHEPPRFRSAVIRLQLGTDRLAEALTHELLHLQQPIKGFPRPVKIFVPNELDPFAPELLRFHPLVLNIVDHELMIDAFLACGFERTRFLNRVQYADYGARARRVVHEGLEVATDFPWWCLEFYRNWANHEDAAGTRQEAEKALDAGSRIYPHLETAAKRMREWTEIGDFRKPDSHAAAVNELFGIMQLPLATGWYVIQTSRGGPVAASLPDEDVS